MYLRIWNLNEGLNQKTNSFAINRINEILRIRKRGRRANRNVLKSSSEGVKKARGVLCIKQSKERNASVDDPILLDSENTVVKLFGIETPNDNETVIN